MHRHLLPVVAICVGILLCADVGHAARAYDFTISGHWYCQNGVRTDKGATKYVIMPVVGARVEFYHSVAGWTDLFDSTQPAPAVHTDANGAFQSATIHARDATNYYARLILNDDNSPQGSVHLENWWTGSSKSYQSPFADSSRGSASFDILISGSSGNPPLCAIWQGAHNAYQEYVSSVGALPPSREYDITVEDTPTMTPWTNLDTTHWSRNHVTGFESDEYDVSFHEFAHSVRHSLDGDKTHFTNDVTAYVYARFHAPCDGTNAAFAFNEGWAEFWAQDWYPAPCKRPGADEWRYTSDPEQHEGNVAYWLDILSHCRGVGRKGMVDVLERHPGAIHSFEEFYGYFAKRFPAARPRLSYTNAAFVPGCGTDIPTAAPAVAEVRPAAVVTTSRIFRAQAQAQAAIVSRLRDSFDAARLAARTPPSSCSAAPQAILAPPVLAAELGMARLLAVRLRSRSAHPPTRRSLWYRIAWESRERAAARAFDRGGIDAALHALQGVLRAADGLAGRCDLTTLVAGVRGQIELLTRIRQHGGALPSSIQFPTAGASDTVKVVAQRITPPPPVVAPPAPASMPPAAPPTAPVAFPAISISDASVKEGNSGTNTLSFTVSLSTVGARQVQVDFVTHDGSASASSDYQAVAGRLSFGTGETSKQVTVKVNGDTTVETDEQLSVELSSPIGATITDGYGIGTIRNDDSATPTSPPAGKPDLTVTALSNAYPGTEFGTDCSVRFTVENIGAAGAGASVTSVHGHAGVAGNWNTNVDTPALSPGESVELIGTIGHACHNTEITVTADTTAVVNESDEDNNFLGATL